MNEHGLADELLSQARVIAVVGYSAKPDRPSNSVSRYLRGQGYRVIPVNPQLRARSWMGSRRTTRYRTSRGT